MRGFTLIEMLVVLTIIVLITGIVLSGQQDFNRSLTVTDTAYTVALSIRQAQTFGLSSRTYNSSVTNAGYGVHFDTATPGAYLMFADVSHNAAVPAYCPVGTAGQPDAKLGNCLFDAGGNEVAQNYKFGRGFTITQLCGRDTSGTTHCNTGGTVNDLSGIDILFTRPNTSSIVTGLRSSAGNLQLRDAQLKVVAPNSVGVRSVCVTQAGEVSVTAGTCP
jgi:prepilin-type N-terminal cleavage/methylation domain-containing protein